MRQLSVVELELIVGGYDSGGGGGDYSYGESSVSINENGEFSGSLAANDMANVEAVLHTAGLTIPSIPIPWQIGPFKGTIKTPKVKIS